MKKSRFADLMAGALLAALGGTVLFLSQDLVKTKTGLGPAGYPRAVAVIMIVLGLVMFISTLLKGLPKVHWAPDYDAWKRVGFTVLISVIYFLLLNHFGFLVLTPFYLFALMWVFGYPNLITAAIASIGSSVVIYLLFTKAFQVFLPKFALF